MWWLALASCGAPEVVQRWIVQGAPQGLPPGAVRLGEAGGLVAVRTDTAAAARALPSWPGVGGVRPDSRYRPALQEGLDAIGQPIAEAQGFTGVGAHVVLFDSGADAAALGCASAGEPGCALAGVVELAPDDGQDDDQGHGTAMAQVVHAVAPGATVWALDVVDTDGLAWESDLVAAWGWAQDLAMATDDPVVVNLSMEREEADPDAQLCPWLGFREEPGWSPWYDDLYIVGALESGVANCESAGSFAMSSVYPADVGRVEAPTCTDETTAADQIPCFGHRFEYAFVAPGVMDTTGGNRFVGNSVASAYTAGAVAVVTELGLVDPYDLDYHFWSPGAEFVSDGVPYVRVHLPTMLETCVEYITDLYLDYRGNDRYLFRVEADEQCDWTLSTEADWLTIPASGTGSQQPAISGAVNTTGAVRVAELHSPNLRGYPVNVTQDQGPRGTIRVRPPPAPFTAHRTQNVTLELTSTWGTEVCLGTNTVCTTFVPMQATLPWTLANTYYIQHIFATFRDPAGIVGPPQLTHAVYDPTRPTGGTLTATGVDPTTVDLAWSGVTDRGAGLLDAALSRAVGTTAPACGTTFVTGSTARETGLVAGTTYTWRLCSRDKAGNVATGVVTTFTARAEYQPPTGTLDLPAASRTSTVTATLAATDDTGVTEQCLSNTTTCTAWTPYTTSVSWNAGGSGLRTGYAWFRDAAGNVAGPVSDTVFVDAVAPSGGTFTATPGDGFLDLAWSGITETGSGVVGYRLARATGTTAPGSCGTTAAALDPAAGTRVSGLVNGTTYTFRLCAVDAAGNVATGLVTTGRPAPELDAPTGAAVSLNAGATWTRSSTVTASLAASDASGVARACLSSSSSSCSAWFTMATSKSFALGGSGVERTVYASFEDPWGNRSAPVSDTIRYDAVAPTNPVVTVSPGDGQLTVSWTPGTDAASGLADTIIVVSTGSAAPANCNGTPAWAGAGPSAVLTGLTNGANHHLRVCHRDLAGNVGTGAVTAGRPAPEFDPPTGLALTLAAGAEWARTTSVPASLAATDPSGVARVCLSSTSTCTAWTAMAPEKTATLGGSGVERTVNAWFEDTWGNVAGPVTDTVRYDALAPTTGALVATGGDGEVTLSWSGFTDATSGVAGYRVAQAAGANPPANCNTAVHTTTATSATLTGLTNGALLSFRVCADDAAGNRSTGATASARPAPEHTPPTGTVEVAGGAAWVGSATVEVTLAATDDSGVARACLSTGTTCTAWFTLAPTRAFTLTGGSGPRTVSAWFEDTWGNVSAPVADDVGLDLTAPTNGTVTATPGSGEVTLAWSGFADAHSGLAGHRVVSAAGTTAPASCTAGTLVYEGPDLGATVTGLAAGSPVSFRVCGVDALGRLGTGARVTATPAP